MAACACLASSTAPHDLCLAGVVLDDRAVVEHGEVLALLLRAAERLAIGVADVVHDVVLVDDPARQIRPPGPEHQVARPVEQEDAGLAQADAGERQLDRAAQDGVRIVERQDLVERRQQRRQLAVRRAVHDLRDGERRPEDDWPVDAAAPGHSCI